MKTEGRNFVAGYYLMDHQRILRGIEYNAPYHCGMVGDKHFVCIKFTPGELPDTQGRNNEMFDMSGLSADEIANHPLFRAAASGAELTMADLAQFPPSSRERVLQSIADGMSVFEAAMMHIARLLPEYCGATFSECIEFRPELLTVIQHTDEFGNVSETPNIQRCSDE